ncbi:3-hydroxyacyl-CoA dehydrogenase NAD-binding domain-containing protein, partial [Brevibacterium epidermidis]
MNAVENTESSNDTREEFAIAVVGTGVIGAAWVSGFLAAGHSVTAFDPAEGAEERLLEQVKSNLEVTTGVRDSQLDRLTFA